MPGPLDLALLMAGTQPKSRPEALHMEMVVWKARVKAGKDDGSIFVDTETGYVITAEQAVVLGSARVRVKEPAN